MEERQMAADAEYEDKALDWIEEITGMTSSFNPSHNII